MTLQTQEVLAGDFIKNLLKNLPKEEVNTLPKNTEIKNDSNETSNRILITNSIILKLKDLKNYIKGAKNKEALPLDTINDCLIYPSILNTNLLFERLFSIFEVKSINEIYYHLIESFNNIYSKDNLQNPNDILNSKTQLFDLIQELNFFISPSLIYVSDPLINKLSFDIFISYILNDNKVTKYILESFINIFNIRHLVLDYFIWNKDKIIKANNHIPKLLSLISILNLEKNYTYDFIFFKKKNIFFEQDNFVYDLYCTYNNSIKELNDLTEYLISIKRNWVSITVIEKIIYDKKISERINNYIKKLMIMNLLNINIRSPSSSDNNDNSLSMNKDKKTSLKLISYYHILSDNKNIINFDFNEETKALNIFLCDLIKNKDYDKCIKLINCLDYKFISHIKKELFHLLVKDLPFNKIEQIKSALKVFPEEINNILSDYEKKNNFKEGVKLIKLLNLDWKEYDKKWDRYSIRIFYNYKMKECLDDKYDILLDYALISETLYNELINKLLNKIKKTKHDNSIIKGKENNNMNSNNNFQILECDLADNYNILNSNRKKDNIFKQNLANDEITIFPDFDIINKEESFNEFSAENIIQQEDSDDDCRIILNNFQNISNDKLKDKTVILFKLGRDKKFLLTKSNKLLFDSIFNYKLPKININNYIIEDKFGPHDNSCYKIDLKKMHVYFVDTISKFTEQYLKYFQHSKIIGIDSEWKQQFYARNKEYCSIIQMANYEERNIIIIDMLKLIKEKEFIEIFDKYFSNKTFIGYSFDSSDLEHFSSGVQNTFKKANIIDLIDLYQYKYLNKAQGLKNMCQEILGIHLCKYEQCSFWENRPLKKSQLHYAAVDALVCVSLYKKLINFS